MKKEVIKTKDGSTSLFISDWKEGYHSHHGAIQEANHVFIQNGFNLILKEEVSILELGFGTGLNAFLTALESEKAKKNIRYYTLEKFPLKIEEIKQMNFAELIDSSKKTLFDQLHSSDWGKEVSINENFKLLKFKNDFFEIDSLFLPKIDLVYFDCFGARVQPELWEYSLLEKVSNCMNSGALFTTYSAKGSLKRDLIQLGFDVEKPQGPKGKREMTIGWKK